MAPRGERRVILSDLVAGGLVPVKVMLAIEAGMSVDGAGEGKGGTYGRKEDRWIQGRLDTRKRGIDGGNMGVGRGSDGCPGG